MLPTHVFADAVGFLRLYGLDGLLLTDVRCSGLAQLAASRIRIFDYSEFRFNVYHCKRVHLHKLASARTLWGPSYVARLDFHDETDLAGFMAAAMRNCVLGNLLLWNKACCEAMRDVTSTIVVKGTLCLISEAFDDLHGLVDFAVSFRNVKVRMCCLYTYIESLCVFLASMTCRRCVSPPYRIPPNLGTCLSATVSAMTRVARTRTGSSSYAVRHEHN